MSESAREFGGEWGIETPPLLKILQSSPRLREKSASIVPSSLRTKDLRRLIYQMRETMRDGPGVGLAAPQIGVPLRLLVIEDREEYHQRYSEGQLARMVRRPFAFQVLANPKIIRRSRTTAAWYETCLSIGSAQVVFKVERPLSIRLQALDERGKKISFDARGWQARIIQHEIDHLDGTLCVDRAVPRSMISLEHFERFIRPTL